MLHSIYAITAKELRVFLKDLGSLFTLFVMPLAFIVIFSLALSDVYSPPEDHPIAIPISVDRAGELAVQIAATLDSADGFNVVHNDADGVPFTAQFVADAVAAGDYQFAIVFPSGFTDTLTDPARLLGDGAGSVTVEFIVDPAATLQVVAPIQGAVAGVIQQTIGQMMNAAGAEQLFRLLELPDDTLAMARAAVELGPATSWSFPVVIQRVNPPNVERELFPDSYQQNVPGYTVMFMFFIVTVIAASVFKERSSGALRRVRATPVSRIAIVIGKTLPFFAINFLQAVIMFTVARLGFSMDLVNIPALLVVTAGLSLAATGMGSMITNLVRTEAQAGSIGVLLILILAMLGGSMIPRSIMPEAMQTIGLIAPQSWALTAYQDVLVRGFGIASILQETLILIAYAAVFLAVSVFRFRYE